ncbi:hypothetical protein ABE10_01985, partial [Bacillus toyonensis]|nr:hypothetical protein [Bacillus toyonensis]
AGKLLIRLPGEDRVHDKGLETGVPESSCLRGACIDVGGGEGDLSGVEEDRLPQMLSLACHPLLGDLDRHADQLERLLQAHTAQQLSRRGGEDVRRDPGGGGRVVVPLDERCDAGLGHQPDGGPSSRWHVGVPRQGVLEPLQCRGREISGDTAQPGEGLRLAHRGGRRGHSASALPAGVAARTGIHIVQVVLGDRLRDERAVHLPLGGQRLERSDDDRRPVDLEEAASGGAG